MTQPVLWGTQHPQAARRRRFAIFPRLIGVGLALCVGSLVWGEATPARADATEDCRALLVDFIGKLRDTDVDAARDLIENIDLYCPPQSRIAARSRLGQLVSRLARLYLERGADPVEVRTEIHSYLPYGDHWELQVTLGNIGADLKDYNAATKHYFQALDLISNVGLTSDPPNEATVVDIHDRASQALMLSEIPVAPTTRGGETAAYFAPTVRGISVPKKTPQITFRTGTDDFDDKGRISAERLLPILQRESPGNVVVIGHTDERGDDAYNMTLSRDRAERLSAFLSENGYTGTVQARWCGERVPVKLVDPTAYTEEERLRINRRVEVFYGQGGANRPRYEVCDG